MLRRGRNPVRRETIDDNQESISPVHVYWKYKDLQSQSGPSSRLSSRVAKDLRWSALCRFGKLYRDRLVHNNNKF
jgi:hypothetical protein